MVIPLNWTIIFEWYQARLAVKHGCQKELRDNAFGFCAQIQTHHSRFDSYLLQLEGPM